MQRGILGAVREVVLGASLVALLAWCVRNPSQGLPVLLALVIVPVLAVVVKAAVEGALILLDDQWARGRDR